VAQGPAVVTDFRHKVKDVVVIASGSRGGSSIFTELLRHSPDLVHFQAEINPFLVIGGLGFPHSDTGSDALGAQHVTHPGVPLISEEMALDAGRRVESWGLDEMGRMAMNLAWRLAVQWPELVTEPSKVVEWTRVALDVVGRNLTMENLSEFHVAFLQQAQQAGVPVDMRAYDLPPDLIGRDGAAEAFQPLGSCLVEEPPFVTVSPWRQVDEADLASRPLVIKTPSNAYRLPFLRAFFPNARFRVLHLTRNPAGSINGLFDGWRYHGFHVHWMSEPLAIKGYSHAHWWKYDLPPGWENWTKEPLEQVCGFQWRSAHQSVLNWLDSEGSDVSVCRVRFEDVVRAPSVNADDEVNVDGQLACFQQITDWLGIPFGPELQQVIRRGAPPVMATVPPRQRRWFARADLLEPVLRRKDVRELADRMGYGDETTWI